VDAGLEAFPDENSDSYLHGTRLDQLVSGGIALDGLNGDTPFENAFLLMSEHLVCKKIFAHVTADKRWSPKSCSKTLRMHGLPFPMLCPADLQRHQKSFHSSAETTRQWVRLFNKASHHLTTLPRHEKANACYHLPHIASLPMVVDPDHLLPQLRTANHPEGFEKLYANILAGITMISYSMETAFCADDPLDQFQMGALPLCVSIALLQVFDPEPPSETVEEWAVAVAAMAGGAEEAPAMPQLNPRDYVSAADLLRVSSSRMHNLYWGDNRDALADVPMPAMYEPWQKGFQATVRRQLKDVHSLSGVLKILGLRCVAKTMLDYSKAVTDWHETQMRGGEYESDAAINAGALWDAVKGNISTRSRRLLLHLRQDGDELQSAEKKICSSHVPRLCMYRAAIKLNTWRDLKPGTPPAPFSACLTLARLRAAVCFLASGVFARHCGDRIGVCCAELTFLHRPNRKHVHLPRDDHRRGGRPVRKERILGCVWIFHDGSAPRAAQALEQLNRPNR
jgi:hypothetical protein